LLLQWEGCICQINLKLILFKNSLATPKKTPQFSSNASLILLFGDVFCVYCENHHTYHGYAVSGSTALVDLGRFFCFLIYTQSVGLLGLGIIPSQNRFLCTEQHTINAHLHPCVEWD
jgi:hypothetical protein